MFQKYFGNFLNIFKDFRLNFNVKFSRITYKPFIQPIITCRVEIWSGPNVTYLNQLNTTASRFIEFILNISYNAYSEIASNRLNVF